MKPITNTLYFGDNLDTLRVRQHLADESADLIYLDPPFNSQRDYHLLFKTPKGHASEVQITAFEDSWHWGDQAEHRATGVRARSTTLLRFCQSAPSLVKCSVNASRSKAILRGEG
jgi:hypothetical protein